MKSARNSKQGRISVWLENQLGALAVLSYRHPIAVVAVVLISVGGAVYAARDLRLGADLTDLVPSDFKSMQDIRVLQDRFGGIGYVAVVGKGEDAEALRRFADETAPRLEALDSVAYVEYTRPVGFFEERALYYLDLADLETIRDRLKDRYKWEKRRANPLYLDFEDADPPPVDFADIQEKYTGQGGGSWVQSQLGEEYYIDPEEGLVVLLVKPRAHVSDLDACRRVVAEVQAAMAGVDLAAYGDGMELGYAGGFVTRVDQQAVIEDDLDKAMLAAVVLMTLYLGVHFRRVTAVGLLMAPVAVGVCWTFGFAAAAFGVLNLLTGFVAVILLGLGIDHGIHLLGRYELEVSRGRGPVDAIRQTYTHTGRAVLIAALTTCVGFAGLGLSRFVVIRELGILAAVGMLAVVVAFTVLLPALLAIATRLGWAPAPPPGDKGAPLVAWLRRKPFHVAAACTLLVALTLPAIRNAEFDSDFAALSNADLESIVLDREVNRIIGHIQNPVAVMVDGEVEERFVARELREQKGDLGSRSLVQSVVSMGDLVPPQQEEKQQVLASIGRTLRRVDPGWLEPRAAERLEDVRAMTTAEPFAREDLPPAVVRQLVGRNGSVDDGVVLVFPSFDMLEGAKDIRFAAQLRAIQTPDGGSIAAAGEAMVWADLLTMVIDEAPIVLGIALLLVFVCLWLLLGDLRTALLCVVPAVATLAVALGLLDAVGMKLNYLNMVMIPVFFGVGVDGAVHIVTGRDSGQPLGLVLRQTGRAIAASTLTSGLGFGVLLLAHHPGLNSLGCLALLGLGVNLLICLVAMPAYLVLRERWANRSRAERGSYADDDDLEIGVHAGGIARRVLRALAATLQRLARGEVSSGATWTAEMRGFTIL